MVNIKEIEKTNYLSDFYKQNIIDYYNISVIKKILNKYVKTSDFNEYSFKYLLEDETLKYNHDTIVNSQMKYQNELIKDAFSELFKEHSYDLSYYSYKLEDKFMDFLISELRT